ncbi:bifunctional metallophosphatase/5'-nucleotidase [Arcanobacterium ihumii]|uniref:bifunctional metallophosphatase/5'-nucleotidase n=1 Tax=Arcanobacterium ihumii TaxID=2138162 RepID=UPI000F52EB64|nr:bifunctional UDP-sugar hydrolase/5'-nucleotidase [Arcanobacterium ihumii]
MKSTQHTSFATKAMGAVSALTLGMLGLSTGISYAATGDITIDLAVISDFHGQIDKAAALDYQIDAMRTANPNTRFVSVGDSVGGSAYVSSIDNDTPTLNILKAMQLSVTAAGNHEFDKGYQDLVTRIKPALGIPILSANLQGAKDLEPYYIEEISGVKVAYVGTVTDEMPTLVSASAIQGLTFSDPVAATNAVAAQLKDGDTTNGEADVVVALIHKDIAAANQLGSQVDIAFAGHSHISQTGKTASNAPTCQTVNAGGDFAKGQIIVSADHRTVTASCSLAPINVADGESADIKSLYEAAKAKSDVLGAEKVGNLANDAFRGAAPSADPTKPEDIGIGGNRGTESSAGNLLAEAFYQYSKNFGKPAQLGIMNPGGVRADLAAGEITKGESYTVQPFGNVFGTKDLTGAQLYTLLEQQWRTDPKASHPTLRLGLSSNVKYVYDPVAPVGSKVTELYVDGAPVAKDATKKYTLASNTFLLEGGDGFAVLKEGTGFVDTGMKDNDAFNAFLKDYNAKKGDYKVDYSQRSFGITLPAQIVAGKHAKITVSSLSMTATEPKATEALVSIEGVGTQKVTLDNKITAKQDETGKGEALIDVPASTPAGNYTLKVSAKLPDGTLSEVTKPIVIKAATPAPPVVSGPIFADDAAVKAHLDATGLKIDTIAALPGQTINLTFKGLPAQAKADVYFYSAAKLIATNTVAMDGTLSVSYTLPMDIATGIHYAVAQTPDRTFRIVRVQVGEVPTTVTAPGVATTPGLAKTGSQSEALIGWSVALVLGGLALTGVVSRRRKN